MKTNSPVLRSHSDILLQNRMQKESRRGMYSGILLVICSLVASLLALWGSPRIFFVRRICAPAGFLWSIPHTRLFTWQFSGRLRL
jgi:hypothetical protein